MAKILLVEDDQTIADNVRVWLEKQKHAVDHTANGREGLELLLHYEYELAILDWHLPEMEGADICVAVRKAGKDLPILMLTSRSSLSDRVRGLDSGAYDYVVKPCPLEELSARVRALLRRSGNEEGSKLAIGDLEIRSDSHEVLKDGMNIQLSPSEFEILKLLARHPDDYFSADAILSRLWSDKPQVSKQLVKVHVMNLRKKLAATGTNVSIAMERSEGYFLSVKDA